MAYIESHQTLRNHPKLKRFVRMLGIDVPTAIGYLHLLWWYCLDYAQDGDITDFGADGIADACEWPKDSAVLYTALRDCGLREGAGFIEEIDGRIVLHDWYDYAGRLIEQRAFYAERARRKRGLYDDKELTRMVRARDGDSCRYCGAIVDWSNRKGPGGGTYDHIDPEGPNTPENIAVACRRCNAQKNRRTPENAGMPLLPAANAPADSGRFPVDNLPESANGSTRTCESSTAKSAIPNLTKPNLTKPNQTKAAEDAADVPPPVGIDSALRREGFTAQEIESACEHLRAKPAGSAASEALAAGGMRLVGMLRSVIKDDIRPKQAIVPAAAPNDERAAFLAEANARRGR